jgi:hypothetical protein
MTRAHAVAAKFCPKIRAAYSLHHQNCRRSTRYTPAACCDEQQAERADTAAVSPAASASDSFLSWLENEVCMQHGTVL